jgi:hypothetical protein
MFELIGEVAFLMAPAQPRELRGRERVLRGFQQDSVMDSGHARQCTPPRERVPAVCAQPSLPLR